MTPAIEFTRSYRTSDGNVFGTLQLAQEHELTRLLLENVGTGTIEATMVACATVLVGNAEKVVDILTTTKTSRPKARRINKKVVATQPATKTKAELEPV